MAGSLSDYQENAFLDHVLKTTPLSQSTNLYLALVTTLATDASIGATLTEPASNYARVNHNSWDAAASRASENTGSVTFVEATGSWGTIVGWAIVDSASGAGNIICHGDFSVSRAINSGDTGFVADGDIDISVVTDAVSNYLANAMLDHLLKGTAFSVPTNIYCAAIITSVVVDADTGSTITEPVGGSYARTLMNAWDAAAAGASENTNAITFPEATGAWGTVIDVAFCDASTVGNLLFYANMDASKAVDSGDTMEFIAGAFDLTLD